MKRVFIFAAVLLLTSRFTAFTKHSNVRMEAEDADGKYVVVDSQEASAGKYIGIDHTLNENNEYNYYLIFENMPATTAIKMVYATGAAVGGEVKIYVLEGEEEKQVGAISFNPSGGWDPFGDSMLVSVVEDLTIEQGSTIVMKATMSVNIDYFEFTVDDSPNPQTSDTLFIVSVSIFAVSCLFAIRKKQVLVLG